MKCKLSILIPTTPDRKGSLSLLLAELSMQCGGLQDVVTYNNCPIFKHVFSDGSECIVFEDEYLISIGEKRTWLYGFGNGDYLVSIDSDDTIGRDYIKHAMEGIRKGVDCVSLRGVITWNGENPEIFEHSIKYDSYKTNDTGVPKYERYPNHLNIIKSSIAKQFKFPSINHGEDTDWATQIKNSGLIKTEHYVDAVTYHYQYVTNK